MPTMTTPSKAAPQASSVVTFRNLYTRVLLSMQARQHQVLGVTSAIAGEGKTTIAGGLAAALAEDGALLGFGGELDTALLVECNLGTPTVEPLLTTHAGPGLVQVLRGECTLEEA